MPGVGPADATSTLAQEDRDAGATVGLGETVQSFFPLPDRVVRVNGEDALVLVYPSTEMAEADAATVWPDGGTIGVTSILWAESAHFLRRDTLIALYVGDDTKDVRLLADALRPQFTGAGPDECSPDTHDLNLLSAPASS